jgi:hypothetical protein
MSCSLLACVRDLLNDASLAFSFIYNANTSSFDLQPLMLDSGPDCFPITWLMLIQYQYINDAIRLMMQLRSQQPRRSDEVENILLK